jgi:hypothetical protein
LWRPRPVWKWGDKVEKEFRKEYKAKLRKEILEADEKEKVDLLEFFKLQKEKTKEKFFDLIRPLQQRYQETKDKRRAIVKDDDSDTEETYTKSVICEIA